QAPSVGLLRLGNFSEVVKKFSEINELWIKQLKIKEFNRVALGTQIVYEVKDRVNGYKKLSGLLPFQLKAEEFSDFSLQINKPHKYKFISRELNINRLIKWSVLRLNFGIQSVGDPKTQHKFPDQNYCSIVMDINTQPEQGKFNNEDATKLINNFIKLSMEISEQGLK
ncbi:MAG: hypothetical protein ACREHC_02150, partial [Candidatus Levyibacteriota bacterium]